MCVRIDVSGFEKLTHLLSGDTATEPIRPISLEVTTAVLPSASEYA